jgi:hypothetical protein
MSSSRIVPIVACAVIALGALLVVFVLSSGRNDPQPGSQPPVGYVPPREFVERVEREKAAWDAKVEKAREIQSNREAAAPPDPPLDTPAEEPAERQPVEPQL